MKEKRIVENFHTCYFRSWNHQFMCFCVRAKMALFRKRKALGLKFSHAISKVEIINLRVFLCQSKKWRFFVSDERTVENLWNVSIDYIQNYWDRFVKWICTPTYIFKPNLWILFARYCISRRRLFRDSMITSENIRTVQNHQPYSNISNYPFSQGKWVFSKKI